MNVIGKCLESDCFDATKSVRYRHWRHARRLLLQFNIYLPKVIQLLESLMTINIEDENTDLDKIDLRAEATSCLGAVAGAVGYDAFKSILPKFHEYVMDGLIKIDNSDIRESSFMYFGELADIMGPNILKLESFEEMLNFVLFVMEDDDGLMVELPDDGFGDAIPKNLLQAEHKIAEIESQEQQRQIEAFSNEEITKLMQEAIAAAEDDDDADDNEDDEGEDEDEDVTNHVAQLKTIKLNVTTGFMEEKAAAVHALTAFIKNGGYEFLQYMDECWERLNLLWEYPHSLVKMSVSSCFHEFFTLIVNESLHNVSDAVAVKSNYKYPFESNIDIEYSNNVSNWITNIFPLYIDAIREEEDRDALNVIIDFFIEELKVLGPNSINKWMDDLIASINLYLKEECRCQESSDPQNNDTKDIGTKHQWLSDTIADLIATLAQLFGTKI
eukprot:TRINITY_DN127_c0_g1_i1.p1 TRINITY_DN127_c0_g1~~TRINITY_DN127_c0_g1_i1.p1  ORF type:complete len:442 (-),score=135.78 TRINITY_DN127_c0_g1_i1:205-1530(-)